MQSLRLALTREMAPLLHLLLLLASLSWHQVEAPAPQAESAECLRHIARYQAGLLSGQLWALQMFDSASKVPDGLLKGNIVQLGNYDECVDAVAQGASASFTGQYCRVVFTSDGANTTAAAELEQPARQLLGMAAQLTPLRSALLQTLQQQPTSSGGGVTVLPLQWSVCAPSTCGPEGVARVAELNVALLTGGLLAVSAVTVPSSCFFHNNPAHNLDSADWGMVGLLALLVLVIAASTAYECLVLPSAGSSTLQVVLSTFSLRRNLRQLMSTHAPSDGMLSCVHGVRVLSLAWIVLGHRYTIHTYLPSTNVLDVFTSFIREWSSMTIMNGFLAVDTFFLLSGLLVSYVVCCDAARRKLLRVASLPAFYLYRYLRLTPPLAVVVFLSATLVAHASHGPMWGMFVRDYVVQTCRDNWWQTLLYVNNYVISSDGICVGQSWYLSIDMQLSWLSPLLLLPLVRWPRPALAAILVLTLASVSAVFTVTYIHELTWTFSALSNLKKAADFTKYVYVNTPMRAAPYLCGMALGYALSRLRVAPRRRLPSWLVALGWTLSTAVCLTVIYSLAIFYQAGFEYDRVDAAFYAALHRLAWALGLSWVIYACSAGHGGPVNRVLSWGAWQPLSRLSYCVFLVHLTMMFMEGGTWRNPRHFSNFEVVHGFLGDLLLLVPPTLALYLAVEAPTNSLLRLVFKKDTPPAPSKPADEGSKSA